MIYKGSSGLKAYVGSTEVSKMYKGDVLVYSSAPVLPYDAQVEWLGSSGTEYIQLPVAIAARTFVEVESVFIPTYISSSNYEICGGTPWQQFDCTFYSYNENTNRIVFSTRVGNVTNNGGYTVTSDVKNTVRVSTTAMYSNDGTTTLTDKTVNRMLGARVTGFRVFGGYKATTRYPIKYCSFKLTAGSSLLYDLIPVRKNGVGYLYDKISGTLYGNAGTGAFTYGADVSS